MMTTASPFVAVFVPTKNDEQFIASTLMALFDEASRYARNGGRVWIGLANDGSTDHTPRIIGSLLSYCPCPHMFIDRSTNLGVTVTLAELAAAAPGDAEVYLRCDADARFLTSGWMSVMASFLMSSPLVGAVAPIMIFPDGTIDCHGVRYFPGGREFLVHDQYLTEARPLQITEVDTVLGAYCMMRKTDWEIDTGYFLWIEDEDQGLTLRRKGKKCFSLGNLILVHYNRIRTARVSDRNRALAVPQSRSAKLKRAAELFAAGVLPDFVKRWLRPIVSNAGPPRLQQIMAQSEQHFADKWGFHPAKPDLDLLRTRYASSELLWFENDDRRRAGEEIVRQFNANNPVI